MLEDESVQVAGQREDEQVAGVGAFQMLMWRHMYVMQVEEMRKKADDTARALRAVGAKNNELEATIQNLASSQSSSEDQLRSQAAQVLPSLALESIIPLCWI